MTTIETRGSARREVPAERATVTARIQAEAGRREQSIRQATEVHNQLVERAKRMRDEGTAAGHSAEPIRTVEYDTGRLGRQFVTESTVRVELQQLEIVSGFMTELARLGVTASVQWSLTEARRRELERGLRAEAVAQAREIADDYAAALGQRVDAVARVWQDDSPGWAGTARFAAAAEGQPSQPPAEITVPDVAVSAAVRAEFTTASA